MHVWPNVNTADVPARVADLVRAFGCNIQAVDSSPNALIPCAPVCRRLQNIYAHVRMCRVRVCTYARVCTVYSLGDSLISLEFMDNVLGGAAFGQLRSDTFFFPIFFFLSNVWALTGAFRVFLEGWPVVGFMCRQHLMLYIYICIHEMSAKGS